MNKHQIVSEILKLTNKTDSETFDKLIDRDESYLIKLLNVIKGLK